MSTNDDDTKTTIDPEKFAEQRLEVLYTQMYALAEEIQNSLNGKKQIIVSGAIRILMLNMQNFRPQETMAADQIVNLHIKNETLKARLEEMVNDGSNKVPPKPIR